MDTYSHFKFQELLFMWLRSSL